MPLTNDERRFLDAYVYEATHEPFGGPATEELRRREIFYADLHGLLTGYHRELTREKILPFGKQNSSPPPSPWANRDDVTRRSRDLLGEHGCSDEIIMDGGKKNGPAAPAAEPFRAESRQRT